MEVPDKQFMYVAPETMTAACAKFFHDSFQSEMLSQQDLAVKSGVTEATISRIANGHPAPRPSTVRELAQALGVSPVWLLYGDIRQEVSRAGS
jgi:ribosome-binding protein aMBF1 (putative translation factor)